MPISTINNLEFEYFTKEELLKYKLTIENRVKEIDEGLAVQERPLRYFAHVDVMYGDADGYSRFAQEISSEDYIKLRLFKFVYVTFYHEQLGESSGKISDFITVEDSYVDLSHGSSLVGYYNELERAIEEIESEIESYYPDDLDYEELYKLYLNKRNFNIEEYKRP